MDLIPLFTARGQITTETFSEVFATLTEEQKQKLAMTGTTELLLRCFDPDWFLVSLAFSRFTQIPATRYLGHYSEIPTAFYPEEEVLDTPELNSLLGSSHTVYRDFVRIMGRVPSVECPAKEPKVTYKGSLVRSALPVGFTATNALRVNKDSDGTTSEKFLRLFGINVPLGALRVPWTFDDLEPTENITFRIILMVADALEWMGHGEGVPVEDHFYSLFYEDRLELNQARLLAEIGFTEAFMYANQFTFEWKTVAGIISNYTEEAPSAVMLRNSSKTYAQDAELFLEEPIEGDWLVTNVISHIEAVSNDFIAIRKHQDEHIYNRIAALRPFPNEGTLFKRLCPNHQSQAREFLPYLKEVLCLMYRSGNV
jgi:hypothetical protein